MPRSCGHGRRLGQRKGAGAGAEQTERKGGRGGAGELQQRPARTRQLGNFDNNVPAEFDAILNQPESENESVRSKLKLAGLARPAQVLPSKFTLPSISPGCCWLASTVPFMVALLPFAVESFNCGAVPAGFSFRWYTAMKLLPQVADGRGLERGHRRLPVPRIDDGPVTEIGRIHPDVHRAGSRRVSLELPVQQHGSCRIRSENQIAGNGGRVIAHRLRAGVGNPAAVGCGREVREGARDQSGEIGLRAGHLAGGDGESGLIGVTVGPRRRTGTAVPVPLRPTD